MIEEVENIYYLLIHRSTWTATFSAGGDLPTVQPRPPLSAAPCVSSH